MVVVIYRECDYILFLIICLFISILQEGTFLGAVVIATDKADKNPHPHGAYIVISICNF